MKPLSIAILLTSAVLGACSPAPTLAPQDGRITSRAPQKM